jgi:L-threonylcarbamoyladenylate synthase
MILDGGPSPLGIESTVVSVVGPKPSLLRPGAIPREAIERLLGGPLAAADAAERAASPGQQPRHYAPRTPLRLDATAVGPDEALLAFGTHVPQGARLTLNLSQSGDLEEAAAKLFAALRELDQAQASAIAVMPIPQAGLGEAINDRLRRAANRR